MKVVHRLDMNITITSDGSILAIGKDFMPLILRPVTNMMIPPHAEKSAIMSGVVKGIMIPAKKKSPNKTIICGITAVVTIYPNAVANIAAVKKSRKLFEINTEASPVIPSFSAPKIPVPLALNRTTIPMNFSIKVSSDSTESV